QAEPAALRLVGEAVEMDVILAHMRLDEEPHRLAARRHAAQGARRGEDEIADAVDVEHQAVAAALLDEAGEHRDHRAAPADEISDFWIVSSTPSRFSMTSLFQKRSTRKPACSRSLVRCASFSDRDACWPPSSSTMSRCS